MSNNVLVIGNGFDLAHNMETTYNHFIEYVKNLEYKNDDLLDDLEKEEFDKIVENNGFIKYFLNFLMSVPGWVDFEREIYRITTQFKKFFDSSKEMFLSNNRLSKTNSGELLVAVLNNFGIVKIIELNIIIEPRFYSSKYGINKREILKELKLHLNELIRGLELYLEICQRKFEKEVVNASKVIKQIKEIKPIYVISFNYTDTYKIYNIAEHKVSHIHGKIGEKNIVLGVDDKTPQDLDFIYFKKYFQRIQKGTDLVDWTDLVRYIDGYEESPLIHFYGHSMDKTDEDIIRELKGLAEGFVIYIYNQEDYEQKVVNLIDIFGKKEAVEMIQTDFIQFVKCDNEILEVNK